jgi:DNA-binding CsgD family transcriptional regulator
MIANVSLRFCAQVQGTSGCAGPAANHEPGHAELRDRAVTASTQIASLSARQRQVLDAVVAGQLNKQIAWSLGISEKTVKMHRAQLMLRLGAPTTSAAVRVAVEAAFAPFICAGHEDRAFPWWPKG